MRFLADVCFGHFNSVIVSLTLFLCSSTATFLSIMLTVNNTGNIIQVVFLFSLLLLLHSHANYNQL